MKRIARVLVAGLLLGGISLVSGCDKSSGDTGASAAGGCEHQIKQEQCPFCNPEMIETDGFCGEHGVAEALCAQCRPYLKAAFRAKGDWCAEHGAPESQCVTCNPELKENIVEGGGHGVAGPGDAAAADACEHGISETKCPFCTPSLVQSEGFCKGHGVAEALCVKCRPYLGTAFKTKGDWCAEHATPESQCTICNPGLKTEGGEG